MRKTRFDDDSASLPFDPVSGDIIMGRTLVWDGTETGRLDSRVRVNIPQELWLWDEVGFAWGALTPGCYTLALCILDIFLGWTPGVICAEWHHALACRPAAYHWAPAFARNYVAKVPVMGGTITGEDVRQFVSVAPALLYRKGQELRGRSLRELFPSPRHPLSGR